MQLRKERRMKEQAEEAVWSMEIREERGRIGINFR